MRHTRVPFFAHRATTLLVTLVSLVTPAAHAQPLESTIHNFGPMFGRVCPGPEGLTADPSGHLYASSVSFTPRPDGTICIINPDGTLGDVLHVPPGEGGVANFMGLLFEPGHGLYALDFADGFTNPASQHGRLLLIDPRAHTVTVLATGFAVPNALAQDAQRRLYVADARLGRISQVAPDGTRSTVWLDHPALRPAGQAPLGANGLAFDRAGRFLYISNPGARQVLRVAVNPDGSAGELKVFADGTQMDAREGTRGALLNADGLAFDVRGNLYVVAGFGHEVQVLSPRGQLIARYGGAGGDALDGATSLVFHGRSLYLSNFAYNDQGPTPNAKLSRLVVPFAGLPLYR